MNSQLIQFNRFKQRSGKMVKVIRADNNIVETICIVKEFDNGNNSTDDKTTFFSVKDNIQQGDIVKLENNTYIILLQEENINNVYCRYVMRRCDNKIKIYIDNKLHEIPCIIESSNNGVVEGKFIITGDGNLKLTVQDNLITKKIKENMRIIKWGYAWKVIAKSGENKGLTYMYFEKGATNSAYDDMENEIADRWKHEIKHNYSMTITEENIEIEEGKTKQLIVNVTDNIDGKVENVVNPTLIYTSNNTDVVKVDNKGIIQAIGEGETSIKIQFDKIEKIINIKVVKPLPIVTTYSFKTILLDGAEFTGDTITIDNGNSKVLKVTEITKTITQGENVTTEIINNPVVAYNVDNSNITVDVEGKITATNAGNSVITMSYENITRQINIVINDVVVLEITGKDYIIQNFTGSYTSNVPVNWSVSDEGNTTSKPWITIVSSADTSVKLQATSEYIWNDGKNKYSILKATSKDGSAGVEKRIQIKPL